MVKRFFLGMVVFGWAATALAGTDPADESSPMPAPNVSLVGQRHYYAGADSDKFDGAKQGMSKEAVKNLVGGTEYPGSETMRDGFTFALDERRTQFFSFGGWMPPAGKHIDFFVSPEEVLLVYYDSSDTVSAFARYPRNNENVEYIKPGESIGSTWPPSAETDPAAIYEK